MKKMKGLLVFFCCFSLLVAEGQTPFTTGNIVVTRVGDGVNSLGLVTSRAYLDEYTPSGSLVQSIPLPVTGMTGSDTANKFVLSGWDLVLGSSLTLSPDHRFLSLVGYNTGTGQDFNNAGNFADRSIARVDFNGAVNTTTGIAASNVVGTLPSGAVTNDGNQFWVANAGIAVSYTPLGTTSYTQITSTGAFRSLSIYGNQLYGTFANGRVATAGTGLPTTGPQAFAVLPGFTSTGGQMSQFFMADLNPAISGPDVIYIAHDENSAFQKYSFNGTTWVSNGIIGTATDDYYGITGVVSGTSVILYCTRKIGSGGASGGELVTFTDVTGHGGAFSGMPTVIATAGANTVFRGVSMAPAPTSISISVKTFLQGAYNVALGRHKDVTTVWRDVLNANALSQPFNVAPFNYTGTESVAPGFFTSNAAPNNTDMLDWVLLELHDATTPSTIVARKACFIREDGQVVDLDGTSNPTFVGVGAKNYYIVLKHRNHLAIRSSSTVFVNGSGTSSYDFTTAQNKAFQNGAITTNAAMKDLKGDATVFGMWGGNANSNTNVRASGALNNNDYLYIVNILLGGNTGLVRSNEYNSGDLNLDGSIRASGALTNNDYLILVNTILGGNTANVYSEHQ